MNPAWLSVQMCDYSGISFWLAWQRTGWWWDKGADLVLFRCICWELGASWEHEIPKLGLELRSLAQNRISCSWSTFLGQIFLVFLGETSGIWKDALVTQNSPLFCTSGFIQQTPSCVPRILKSLWRESGSRTGNSSPVYWRCSTLWKSTRKK